MKNLMIILTAILTITTINLIAQEQQIPIIVGSPEVVTKTTVKTEKIESQSQSSKFSISPYVTVRTDETPFNSGHYDGGVGIEAAYNLSKTLTLAIHGQVENDARGVFIDEAGSSLLIYPFTIQAFSPYLRVGYAYNFNNENHYGVGGIGGEISVFKSMSLFADVNWYTDIDNWNHNGHALLRIGGVISF